MATNTEKQKQLLESFVRIGQVWGAARRGVIVSFNGARVGTWFWQNDRMMIKPEDEEFRKVIRKLNKQGITVASPAPRIGVEELDNSDISFWGTTMAFETEPLSSAAPGTLDHALKLEGFFLIDLNLSIQREQE
jgi:hypothetical protein